MTDDSLPKMMWFGYPAPRNRDIMQKTQVPAGKRCINCNKPITQDDYGYILPYFGDTQPSPDLVSFPPFQYAPYHYHCLMESVLGPDYESIT